MADKNMEVDCNVVLYLFDYLNEDEKKLEILIDNKPVKILKLMPGQQKILIDKKHWDVDKPLSVVSLKSSLCNISQRADMPRGVRYRGLEIQYIGKERK